MRESQVNAVMDWVRETVGPCEVMSDDLRFHGRANVKRLRALSGHFYLKIHRERASWESEAHGYERWARAFGSRAPTLIAARADEPFALLLSELSGQPMERTPLQLQQEREVWRQAGCALAALHNLDAGEGFGPCGRDGVCVGDPATSASEYMEAMLHRLTERAVEVGWLNREEAEVARRAQALAPAFEGEPPIPCHRDYGPANWLITDEGTWAGVIDFEFAHWDVRVADFSRYPGWEWIGRPDLTDALLDGYGRSFTREEERQLLVGRVRYALGAVVWGREHSFHGFADEGRRALRRLDELIPT